MKHCVVLESKHLVKWSRSTKPRVAKEEETARVTDNVERAEGYKKH